ncbi:MAG: carbohydrate kinase [Alphaproteobacteria bacterium]|nr:carbohydrate kinase [Alphaproteobacteria bacterium]
MKKPQIVGIGEVVFDIFPDSRKLGGAPADFLHHAVKNGADGYLISAIGADDLGREIISELNKFKVNPVLAVTPYPSGRVLIFKSPDGVHSAHILENAAWDYIPFTQNAEDCIKKADAVYFGTLALRKAYSKETILDLIDSAPENAIKYFDINLRQNYYDKELLETLLKKSNILKLNIAELKTLKSLLNLRGANDDMCLKLKKLYNLNYIILSDAVKETKIYGNSDITCIKNSKIHSSFAFGLGNAFGGAFVTSILKGLSQQEAHEIANKTALEVYRSIKG